MDADPTPKGRDSTGGRLLQRRDSLQIPDDSLNIRYDEPESTGKLSEESSSTGPFAFEPLPTPDISTMSLREADGAIRELAQAQFAIFFQNLDFIHQLQVSNANRADNEITRITSLLDGKVGEGAHFQAKLKEASDALDAAEAEQRNADAECVKHQALRALCQGNDFSDAIRHALVRAEEEIERQDQRLEEAVQATDDARMKVESCKHKEQLHLQACDALRQELNAAEKVRDRCKTTGSVLKGSRDEIVSRCTGPRFPHDDGV